MEELNFELNEDAWEEMEDDEEAEKTKRLHAHLARIRDDGEDELYNLMTAGLEPL
jgi:hypothetical protein